MAAPVSPPRRGSMRPSWPPSPSVCESDRTRALPAFASDRLPETARRFLDLAVLPMLLRGAVRRGFGRPALRNRPHAAAQSPSFSPPAAAAEALAFSQRRDLTCASQFVEDP